MNETELLLNRIASLESRVRSMKLLATIVIIVIAALVLMGQVSAPPRVPLTINQLDELQSLPKGLPAAAPAVQDEIRAHQVILVDEKGKDRASLVSDNAGSVFLILSDSAGKTRVNLSVTNDGPSVVFLDPSGQARTILGSTTLVGSHVNDNGVAELAPPSSIVLFDGKGKLLFRTP
jgi:hypothetical protein